MGVNYFSGRKNKLQTKCELIKNKCEEVLVPLQVWSKDRYTKLRLHLRLNSRHVFRL